MKKKYKMYMDLTFEASIEDDGKTDVFDLGNELESKCIELIKEHMDYILCPNNYPCIEKINVETDAWDKVV